MRLDDLGIETKVQDVGMLQLNTVYLEEGRLNHIARYGVGLFLLLNHGLEIISVVIILCIQDGSAVESLVITQSLEVDNLGELIGNAQQSGILPGTVLGGKSL